MNFPSQLLNGYCEFLDNGFARYRQTYEEVACGQKPNVMVVSCCDSRVTPERIFGAGPGDLFVIRNIANLVPPFMTTGGMHGTSAAIEYGVTGLHVSHVVVMGHARCGGIQAFRQNASKGDPAEGFIGRWIKLLEPAAEALACVPLDPVDDPQLAMEYAGIRQSLKNLMTFPFVADAVNKGDLQLHGAWFDIGSGELRVMAPDTGRFECANAPADARPL